MLWGISKEIEDLWLQEGQTGHRNMNPVENSFTYQHA